MENGNRTKVESDSDADPDYSDHLKQTQAKNKKKRSMPRIQKILMNLKAKKVQIIFQPKKMKSTTLRPHTKKIWKRILKRILKKISKRGLKKTMKRTWKQNLKSLILSKVWN